MSDLGELKASVQRLWHRMRHVVRYGRVTASNDAGTVTILQVQMSVAELRDNTPMVPSYGMSFNPLPGAEVAMIFSGGDPSNGVVVAVNDQRYRPKNLKPGEVVFYDNLGRSVFFSKDDGIIVEGKDSNVLVKTTKAISIHGDVAVNLFGSGETLRQLVTDAFMQLFNSHTHGAGSAPTQQMTAAHLTGVTKAGGP